MQNNRLVKQRGSPIKGPVKRKNTSPSKKIHFFVLVLSLLHQHSLVFASCSAPVTHQGQGWCALGWVLKTRPQIRLTDTRQSLDFGNIGQFQTR